MADETSADINNPALQPNGEDTSPAIGLISQYVKDLSFENPNAPAVYQWQDAPQIDVQFNIAAEGVGDQLFEVSLKIDVTSKADAGTMFVIELKYAGLFGVRNVPEDQLQPFFLAEAPRILFPFARRVVADAVRDGGFAPLLLEPIDFHACSCSRFRRRPKPENWATPCRLARRRSSISSEMPSVRCVPPRRRGSIIDRFKLAPTGDGSPPSRGHGAFILCSLIR